MQWKHINFVNKIVNVEQQLQKRKEFELSAPKCSGVRDVPLIEPLFSILKTWQKEQKKHVFKTGRSLKQSDFVVVNELNQVFDPNLISKHFREIVLGIECEENHSIKKAKKQRRGLHTLRHTFASHMIKATVDASDLAAILGHHSADFTLRTYVHLFADSKKNAMRKFEAYLGGSQNLRSANENVIKSVIR